MCIWVTLLYWVYGGQHSFVTYCFTVIIMPPSVLKYPQTDSNCRFWLRRPRRGFDRLSRVTYILMRLLRLCWAVFLGVGYLFFFPEKTTNIKVTTFTINRIVQRPVGSPIIIIIPNEITAPTNDILPPKLIMELADFKSGVSCFKSLPQKWQTMAAS